MAKKLERFLQLHLASVCGADGSPRRLTCSLVQQQADCLEAKQHRRLRDDLAPRGKCHEDRQRQEQQQAPEEQEGEGVGVDQSNQEAVRREGQYPRRGDRNSLQLV